MATWMGTVFRMGSARNDSDNQLEIFKDSEPVRPQDQTNHDVFAYCEWGQYYRHHYCNEYLSDWVLWMETSLGRISALGPRPSNPFCHHFGHFNWLPSLGSFFLSKNYHRRILQFSPLIQTEINPWLTWLRLNLRFIGRHPLRCDQRTGDHTLGTANIVLFLIIWAGLEMNH